MNAKKTRLAVVSLTLLALSVMAVRPTHAEKKDGGTNGDPQCPTADCKDTPPPPDQNGGGGGNSHSGAPTELGGNKGSQVANTSGAGGDSGAGQTGACCG
jgi:hypothetical protein